MGKGKKCKWDVERAINTPILSKSQIGIMAKDASPWSRMIIPSKTKKRDQKIVRIIVLRCVVLKFLIDH